MGFVNWRYQRGLLLLSLVTLSGCGSDLLMVGVDDDGKVVEKYIGHKNFENQLFEVFRDTDQSVTEVVKAQEKLSAWALRSVTVGLGIEVAAGLGPYKLGASPRFRMVFANSLKPPIP